MTNEYVKQPEWYSVNVGIRFLETRNVKEIERILKMTTEILEGLINRADEYTCSSYDCVQISIKRCEE